MYVIDLKTSGSGMRFSVAGRMAAAIAECKAAHEGCLPPDLHEFGFDPDVIFQNWNAAHFLVVVNYITGEEQWIKVIEKPQFQN